MNKKIIFLITVLAVMFGGTSAIGLADDHETPAANTTFAATVEQVDAETALIKYYVCNLDAEDGAEDECGDEPADWTTFGDWTGDIDVTFPEDGANHGSYASAFAEGYEGAGKGCLMRHIAQSDWGKEGFDMTGTEVLIQAETFCAFNSDKPDGESEVEGEGKPEWAGENKPAWAGPDGDKSLRPGKGGPNSEG